MSLLPIAEPILDAEERFEGFENLMPFRVQNILLVSSLYDSFILREDGRLNELLIDESLDLNLRQIPGITHVSSCAEAVGLARSNPQYNLIVTNLTVGETNAADLAREVRRAGLDIPVVVLGYDYREIKNFVARNPVTDIDRVFLWQGHARHGRPRAARGGRQHPLLFVVPACDLHRADQAIEARDPGRHQRGAQTGAHAGAAQDSARVKL